MGPKAYLEYQLNYTAIDDSACEGVINRYYPRLKWSPLQLSKVNGWVTETMILDATLYRMIYSRRQLYERMVEFWRDHFNISLDKCDPEFVAPWDTDVIRRYAMVNFYAILLETAKSACMMQYLDNASSTSSNPNQNYARELMELHTLGVDGGYTQNDVAEVSRAFTGWQFSWDNKKITYKTFVYNHWDHDDGSKVVLGKTIPAGGGIKDGETILKMLAFHPSTAKHIATKLIWYFMGIVPDQTYLNTVAAAFLKSGGDVKTVLRAVFSVDIMKMPAKFKRPAHLIASAIRQLVPSSFGVNSLAEIRDWYLNVTNHIPYKWSPPNGYPDATEYWAGNMLERWNFGFDLANNTTNSIRYDPVKTLEKFTPAPLLPPKVSAALNKMLFLGEMAPNELADLQNNFLAAHPVSVTRLAGAFALAINSPSYQYY